MRLFVGLLVADGVRDALAAALSDVWARGHDAAWTRPTGWHVTLAYLGETEATPAQVATAAASGRLDEPVPSLRLGPATWFGRALVLRVVDDGWCARLGTSVQAAVAAAGMGVDRREVEAHVTVCRRRRDDVGPTASELDDAVADVDGTWRPSRLEVFASVTGDGPARYPVEAAVSLAPG